MACSSCSVRVLQLFLKDVLPATSRSSHIAVRSRHSGARRSGTRPFSTQICSRLQASDRSHHLSTTVPSSTVSISGVIPSATTKAPTTITCSHSEAAILELSPENIDALSSDLSSSETPDPYSRAQYSIANTTRSSPPARFHHKWTAKPIPPPPTAAEPAPTTPNLPSHKKEPWQVQKASLIHKFGTSTWSPRKRLSPDALSGIRALHAQYPTKYTTPVLAAQFEVSPEAIRRILKSKWQPREDEEESRRLRWAKRGEKIWERMVEVGVRAPKKWRDMGVGKPKAEDVQVRPRRSGGAKKRTGGAIPWDDRREDLAADERAWEHNSLAERIL